MSAERDAGIAALQNGNAAEAIPYLERAVASVPDDYQSLLQLGAAYGQVGRHADAVRTVMQVVTQQPSNAAARYNLAIAYANAGHKEYALTAAQQALQLQPENPQARELVARLSGAPAASAGNVMGTMPTGQSPAPTTYGEPTQTLPGQPAQPTVYGQPASPAPYGQTQMPSAQAPTPYGQTPAPYGAPGGVPPQAGAESYRGQGAAAYGGSPLATTYTPPPRPGFAQVPDKFDMKQALTDWVRVLRGPNAFFAEQAERTGYNAPLAFLVTFGIGGSLCAIVAGLIQLVLFPGSLSPILFRILVGVAINMLGPLGGAFLWGGVLHLVGRLFGNRQPYQRTFRVAAYARAPLLLFAVLSAFILPFLEPAPTFNNMGTSSSAFGLVTPVQQLTPVQFTDRSAPRGSTFPNSGRASSANPFDNPNFAKIMGAAVLSLGITLVALIWVWCLQSIGLQYAQDTSLGSAIGTVFLALVLCVVLCGIGFVLMIAMFAGIGAAGAAGGRGAPGFLNMPSSVPPDSAVWRGR